MENITVIVWGSQYSLERHSSGITGGHTEVCLSFGTQPLRNTAVAQLP